MVGDGALDTTQEGTAVNALGSIYPGTYNGDDQSIIAKKTINSLQERLTRQTRSRLRIILIKKTI
ncbi:MAG: hypothetical protein L6V93_22670 [Clostridiales bacterium]|nr:MAG: hypothetical protein L6V93_22670 [Clostridiales bacterium]